MKAIVWTAYGPPDVLELREVPKPVPGDDEVLIKIHAAAVTAGDCEQRSLKLPLFLSLPMRLYIGSRRPTRITILGMDLAGEIESTGNHVKSFNKGDRVFATTGFTNMGAYAEYICLPAESKEGAVTAKPANLNYAEAAGVPTGGMEALNFLLKANIKDGESVLIIGAGGTIGTFAVQLAKYFGANVTAVDSTEKLDMLVSIGADQVVDYTCENVTQDHQVYDVVFDIAGKTSFSDALKALKKNGRYVLANPRLFQMFTGAWISLISSKKVISGSAGQNTENLVYLKQLIEAGKIKSVIDRIFPLEQTAEAHRYVESGQKKGNVVITMGHGG